MTIPVNALAQRDWVAAPVQIFAGNQAGPLTAVQTANPLPVTAPNPLPALLYGSLDGTTANITPMRVNSRGGFLLMLPSTCQLTAAGSRTTAHGATVVFTATVTGALNYPTGTVTFLNGTTPLGTGLLNGAGVANLTNTTLPTGNNTINANYGGDMTFQNSASAPLVQQVTS